MPKSAQTSKIPTNIGGVIIHYAPSSIIHVTFTFRQQTKQFYLYCTFLIINIYGKPKGKNENKRQY